jgi:hypothetical protein
MARVGVGVSGNQSMVEVGIGVSEGSAVGLGSGIAIGAAQPTSILAAIINIKMIELRAVIGFILPRISVHSLDYLVLKVLAWCPTGISATGRSL